MTNDEVIALVCDPETRLVGATIFDAFARVNINKDVGGAFVTNDDEVTFTQLRAAVQEVRAERDAAIARAERAESELGECKRWIGDVMEAMDNKFLSIQMAPVFIGAMAEMQKAYVPKMHTLRARAEAAEALAASRLDVSPRDALLLRAMVPHVAMSRITDDGLRALTGQRSEAVDWMSLRADIDAAVDRLDDALRAHAAKVSR